MYIAVCDDQRHDALRLQELLGSHICNIFSNPQELLNKIDKSGRQYDLYLLDIYMDGNAAGIELAGEIRRRDTDAAICFISSSNEFYREAYDIQDVNYLLKPVSEDSFKKLIERIERRQTKKHRQSFLFNWNGQKEAVPYNNILYISSNKHIIDIHLKDGDIRHCNAKLDDIEALLDGSTFFRCHQSFIVNLYNIDRMSGSDFMLGEKPIPISRPYLSEAKRRYSEILFEEVD